MNKTFLTAVSAMAIMVASPAFADTNKKHPEPGSQAAAEASSGDITKDAKEAWKNIKKDTSEAASNVSETAQDVYKDAKQAMTDQDDRNAEFEKINVSARNSAEGMIGQPVYNVSGERIAKVRDIILNENGEATMVILGDGDFTGLGKLVAFDYSIMTERSAEGDVITAMTENSIDQAASFSYDRSMHSDSVRVIPGNGYSVSELLDGELVNPEGETLAEVDNILLNGGQADQVVVSFGETLGIGGEQAAISYSDAELHRNGDSVDFKLSAHESMQFTKFKDTAFN